MSLLPTFFHHLRNRDGSFNSMCMNCFETVSDHKAEKELADLDAKHICKETPLSLRAKQFIN
jgi:hypothetical protein